MCPAVMNSRNVPQMGDLQALNTHIKWDIADLCSGFMWSNKSLKKA